MTATLVGKFKYDSAEWHNARLAGLGGSEIAAVLGLSKWESHFSLWHRKQALIPPQSVNADMEWGTRLEATIMRKFREGHPELVVNPKPGTWANADRPWQIANPDGIGRQSRQGKPHGWPDRRRCVVEIKTARDDWEWGEPGTDDIPPYYLTQARWYLDVLDVDVCHVAVLIGGSDYREYVIRPDADDTALMRAAGAAFIASLHAGERPDIDAHDATYRAVKQLADGVIDEPVEIDRDLADRYLAALPAAKAAGTEKQLVTSLVLDAIGNYTRAVCGGQRIATRAITKATGATNSLRPARTHTITEGTDAA